MGLHPADRVRQYREQGYWNDDMIDALLRERVRQHGDIPAIVDPLNRDALMDGPVRSLTWPQVDEQVSRLAQVLLEAGIGPGDVVGVQLPNTVEIAVAFLAIVRLGAIVAPFPVQYRAWELTHLSDVAQVRLFITAGRIGQRRAAEEIAGLRSADPVAADGGRVRDRPAGPRARARRGHRGGRGPERAGRPPGRFLPRPERLRHDLLDLGNGEHAQGRPADPLRLDGDVHGHGGRPGPDRRRRAAQPVPDGEHGRHQRHVPAVAEGGRAAGTAPPVRPGHVPAADRAVPRDVHRSAARAAYRAAAQRGAAGAGRHLLAAPARLRLDAAGAEPAAGLARHVRHRDHQLLRLQRGHRAARHA